jgi:hypothetical protein
MLRIPVSLLQETQKELNRLLYPCIQYVLCPNLNWDTSYVNWGLWKGLLSSTRKMSGQYTD